MRIHLLFTILTLIFSFFCLPVLALEIGADFRIGNLAFSHSRQIDDTEFDGMDFSSWGISVYGSHWLSDKLKIHTGYYSDLILRNIYYTKLLYTESFLSLGVGPFFGLLNAGLVNLIKPGISTQFRLDLSGIIFIEFYADNTLNVRLVLDGDYIQEQTNLIAGFFLPNALCTINILSKEFTKLTIIENKKWEYIDSLVEYSFKTNLFKKNVPYNLSISLAYQILSKSFVQNTAVTEHSLHSFILGTDLTINFSPAVHYFINVENSIYTFGQEELVNVFNPGPLGYSFRAHTGILINIDRIIQSSKKNF